jgi:outer membrane lipoprotein SlyB
MNGTNDSPPSLSPRLGWFVGGGLALVAFASLATALALRPPADARSEPRETVVSTKSPTPKPAAARELPAPMPVARPAAGAAAACADCAVVQAVTAIERKGEATGLGAVGGAVAGGLLGSQMGGGSGKDAMTVIGAVGGGVAGHHMERKLRTTTEYRVRVAMADGRTRTLSHPSRLAVGERVRVDGDRLVVAVRAPAPGHGTAPTRTAPGTEGSAEAQAARPRSMADAKRL